MEDYVLIDSVLQAQHMSIFTAKPKHIKRYEVQTARVFPHHRSNHEKFINMKNVFRYSHRQALQTANPNSQQHHQRSPATEQAKIKTKTIL